MTVTLDSNSTDERTLGVGQVARVIGPVVDVEFPAGGLPEIYTALTVTNPGISDKADNLTIEVAQHLGENTARCIAMDSTEGLVRGMACKNTGDNIAMPVGKEVLGRILNVVGEPVDERGPVKATRKFPIHRPPPALTSGWLGNAAKTRATLHALHLLTRRNPELRLSPCHCPQRAAEAAEPQP